MLKGSGPFVNTLPYGKNEFIARHEADSRSGSLEAEDWVRAARAIEEGRVGATPLPSEGAANCGGYARKETAMLGLKALEATVFTQTRPSPKGGAPSSEDLRLLPVGPRPVGGRRRGGARG